MGYKVLRWRRSDSVSFGRNAIRDDAPTAPKTEELRVHDNAGVEAVGVGDDAASRRPAVDDGDAHHRRHSAQGTPSIARQ